MWQLWTMVLFPLPALHGVEHGSKGGSNGSLPELQDGLTRNNETVPENETGAPWRATRAVSTTRLPMTPQSSTDYKSNPTNTSKGFSASFYAKYLVPSLIVLVVLLALFLMYRRKRGREIHSSMESINESSESDNEACPSVEQTAEVSFLHEAIKPLPEESASIAEAAAISTEENASDTPTQLPTQA
ncbi:uncharacterized protein PHA67_000896 [Liasis olivaceus]